MEKLIIKACAPPACSCPVLEIEPNVDGQSLVIITDDYEGTVVMTIVEFAILASKFLEKYKDGVS